MLARSISIAILLGTRAASAEPSVGVQPYLEPVVFTYWDLDYRVSGVRTQLAVGAELLANDLAGRIGLTVNHGDIGGTDDKTVGIDLGGSIALGRFGRVGPSASISTGTRDLVYFSTAGLRYRYRFMTAAVEVGWTKYDPRGVEPFHRRNLFVGLGFTGKPGIANVTGVVLLGITELVLASFPRT